MDYLWDGRLIEKVVGVVHVLVAAVEQKHGFLVRRVAARDDLHLVVEGLEHIDWVVLGHQTAATTSDNLVERLRAHVVNSSLNELLELLQMNAVLPGVGGDLSVHKHLQAGHELLRQIGVVREERREAE